MKKFVQRSILFFISLLVTLMLVEVILRMTHLFGARVSWAKPDSKIGYSFIPGAGYWDMLENDHPVSGRINRYGWRDRDWSEKKPAGQYRAAILGDSFVEAMQVEEDSTFLNLVEKQLSGVGGLSLEMMNFGRSGFTQSEELIVLEEKALRFDPDIVFLFFLPDNDIREILPETAVNKDRPFYRLEKDGNLALDTSFVFSKRFRLKSKLNILKRKSILISLMAERYNAAVQVRTRRKRLQDQNQRQSERLENKEPYRIKNFLNLASSNPDPVLQKAYDLNKVLISKMAQICRERKVTFTLVLVGSKYTLYDETKGYLQIDPQFDMYWFEKDLKDFCRRINIPFIDLQTVVNNNGAKGGYDFFWTHWNYRGHQLVAGVLADFLRPYLEAAAEGSTAPR